MNRYYDSFPAAPKEMVEALAAACEIPNIVGARVGKDGSVYLDIFQSDEGTFRLNVQHLGAVAVFLDVPYDEVTIESGPNPDILTVTSSTSRFDFNRTCWPGSSPITLDGAKDSEESVEASAALAASRRE